MRAWRDPLLHNSRKQRDETARWRDTSHTSSLDSHSLRSFPCSEENSVAACRRRTGSAFRLLFPSELQTIARMAVEMTWQKTRYQKEPPNTRATSYRRRLPRLFLNSSTARQAAADQRPRQRSGSHPVSNETTEGLAPTRLSAISSAETH